MPVDQSLSPIAILAALGIAAPVVITPAQGGAATAIWRVEHRSTTYALRVFRAEQADVCQREIVAMETAQQAGVPVPAIHAAIMWQDRPVMLLEWCAGEPLWTILQRQPWRVWQLGTMFGRMQATMHGVAAPSAWDHELDAWITWAGPDEMEIQDRLRMQSRAAPALLHLDYHPLNVLSDGRRITCVLDWANARAGDPRADVARTYTILRVEPYLPHQPLWLSMFRRILAHAWRHGYEQIHEPLTQMDLFYAWAGAVMARDLAPRVYREDSWWEPHHLEQIQRWTQRRKQQSKLFSTNN